MSRMLESNRPCFGCVSKKGCFFDNTDGVSLVFNNWRLNLRSSNTEPLLRLNVEGRGDANLIQAKVKNIARIIGGKLLECKQNDNSEHYFTTWDT